MKLNEISIIIPTWNEEDNIQLLVETIDKTAKTSQLTYEVIFIDDHSTDRTQHVINSLTAIYPIRLYEKQGKKGKAQSLIEGFRYARYDAICMIDADLQYPPEVIPEMLHKINEGKADIVVAKRKHYQASYQRKIVSSVYNFIFNKLLYGFNSDVQSGLKVFRKEIVERLTLNPSAWTFDLEFLVKARNAGYKIVNQDIVFSKRNAGKTKVSLIKTSAQIGWSAVKLKTHRPAVIPFHPNTVKEKGQGFHYKGKEFIHYSNLNIMQTAFHRLSGKQEIIITELIAILAFSLFLNWHITLVALIAVLTLLYFADLLFNLFLVYRSFAHPAEIKITKEEIGEVDRSYWPTYTILCPLYKEWKVVPQFVTAMSNLEYPKDKLQVMLLLEEDDKESITNIAKYKLPSYFQVVVVPHSKPKTKPKACNYGLLKATGEYVVIYDAEDVPDEKQLKRAVLAFERGGDKIACIQARLNFYNPTQNVLTRLFTSEYSLWFDIVLIGVQSIHAPIPLGGTSNHFRRADIIRIGGWDSFNVTEDADLGMRLVKAGYRTAIVDSETLEEANSSPKNWFSQRSRWIKGYMQTYLLHMRDPQAFGWKEPHFLTFQLIIGGKVTSMLINPLMWIITISYFLFRAHIGTFIQSFFPAPVLYMGVISLLVGNFLYMYYYLLGCMRHGHDGLVKYTILIPFYWLAMSVAAWVAFYELIVAPHHWAKTKHGLFLGNKKVVKKVNEVISVNHNEDKHTQLEPNWANLLVNE